MLGRIIGAAIGSKIDKSDGRGGVKGALAGAIAAGVIRRAGPVGLAAMGGAYLAKKIYDRRKGRVD
jgi:hypothetical protein